jgi:hypothetical protein
MAVRSPVNLSYDVPFKFNGTIDTVTIDLKLPGVVSASDQELLEQGAWLEILND